MPGIKGPADKTEVKVNGRPMDVALSAAAPTDVSGDAYLSFMIDNDAKIEDAFKRGSTDDQYIGVIAGSPPKELIESKIEYATFKALKLMGEDGAKSVVIPVSGLLAKRMGLDDTELAASIFQGVSRYAEQVRRDAEPDFVTDIVVAGGVGLYLNWMNGGPMVGNIVREPAEENTGAIVLKGDTFDLSPDKLGSRIGITAFHEETAMSREPDELQRTWLEIIGEDLVNVTKDRGFHRNSPFAPVLPNERRLIVTFDAGTGFPISLQSGSVLPPPENLASGEAAIAVEYFEFGDRGRMAVGKELVVSDTPADPEVLRSIVGIAQFAPILPKANVDIVDMGDGTEIIQPDIDVDEFNRKFVSTVFNPQEAAKMTVMGETISLMVAHRPLAKYLAERTRFASEEDIRSYFNRLSWGHAQYDFYIEEHGLFVGATMHRNMANSPRGTTYHIGATTEDKVGARNVSFRSVKAQDGRIMEVPVSYEWYGKKALAFDAFQRWYNSLEFVSARNYITSDETIARIVSGGMEPAIKAVVLIEYLDGNPEVMQRIDDTFYEVVEEPIPDDREKNGANYAVKRIRKRLEKGRPIEGGASISLAFIELLMRKVLGDEKVDSILAAGETPSFGSAGNVPALPAGGGEEEGPKFLGIAREPQKKEPKAADDDESLLAAAQEEEMAAYAQGSGSKATTSAAIIISSQSVTGK